MIRGLTDAAQHLGSLIPTAETQMRHGSHRYEWWGEMSLNLLVDSTSAESVGTLFWVEDKDFISRKLWKGHLDSLWRNSYALQLCCWQFSVSGKHTVESLKGLGRTKTANPVSNSACCTSIGKLRCLLGKLSHSNRDDSHKEWIKGQALYFH